MRGRSLQGRRQAWFDIQFSQVDGNIQQDSFEGKLNHFTDDVRTTNDADTAPETGREDLDLESSEYQIHVNFKVKLLQTGPDRSILSAITTDSSAMEVPQTLTYGTMSVRGVTTKALETAEQDLYMLGKC